MLLDSRQRDQLLATIDGVDDKTRSLVRRAGVVDNGLGLAIALDISVRFCGVASVLCLLHLLCFLVILTNKSVHF
jgi:hypothetical protein